MLAALAVRSKVRKLTLRSNSIQARFAFLILLFLLIGKFKGSIEPVPAIGGFFTYFVAAISQSFEIYDD